MSTNSANATTRAKSLKQAAPLLEKIKSLCLRRGANGLRGLTRAFRIMDKNKDLSLSVDELRHGLGDCGIDLSHDELSLLVRAFDVNGDDKIQVDEFVSTLRGGLNDRRREIVLRAFNKFDKDGSGIIDVEDLRNTYSAKKNPAVLRGEKTEEQVLTEFLVCFDDASTPDGIVHQCEFEAYYAGVSANIDDDEYFEEMMKSAWKLDEYEGYGTRGSELVDGNGTQGSTQSRVARRQNIERPPAPKRIVGYTGHLPGNIERFGENFRVIESTLPEFKKKEKLPPAPEELQPKVMIKKPNKANAHSYRLE
eukprot:PhF_6_TR29106/c1_g1_i1/m.42459